MDINRTIAVSADNININFISGLKCLTEDDWEEILSGAKPVRGYRASERNKDAAQASDSDDDDFDPALKKKKVPAVKKKVCKSKTVIS